MNIYQELKEAGCDIHSHESDLYVEVTPVSTGILAKYPLQLKNATKFTSQLTGKLCYDIPFAYDPWWTARASKVSDGSTLAQPLNPQSYAERHDRWTAEKNHESKGSEK